MESQSKPKRDIIRLHLAFITSSFWAGADATTREEIFHDIFFPFLLYSKSRQKRASIVWEIINQTLLADATSSLSEWLAGCADIVAKAASGSGNVDSVELLNGINFDLAEKIAGKQTPPILYLLYRILTIPCTRQHSLIRSPFYLPRFSCRQARRRSSSCQTHGLSHRSVPRQKVLGKAPN